MIDTASISVTAAPEAVISFYSILQKGFFLLIDSGKSLQEFLEGECAINEDYIRDRIKTVFLNGKPVDDFKEAVVNDGVVLSLSGPMPGLVGATMRAGGFYSSFRKGITYSGEGVEINSGRGMVLLKIFNIVMSDLGRTFLERGIFFPNDKLIDFFNGQKEEFWDEIRGIYINGKETRRESLIAELLPHGDSPVILKLEAGTS